MDTNEKTILYIQAISGATAGFCSAVLVNPLDVIKIRIQNNSSSLLSSLDTFKLISSTEGFRGLFRGIGSTSIAYIVDRAIWFPCYHSSKNIIQKQFNLKSDALSCQILASIFSSFITLCCVNPLWVVRTRIFTQPSIPQPYTYYYTSLFHGLTSIYYTEGFKALYKGFGPSLLGISHIALQFPLYEQLKIILIKNDHDTHHSSIIIASSLSKMIASTLTYPHEVIRTRLQTQVNVVQYTSLLQSIIYIYKKEGWNGFYKGLGTNLIRTVPASACSLLIYEIMQKNLTLITKH